MGGLLWGWPELSDGNKRRWVILGWEEAVGVGECEGAAGTRRGADTAPTVPGVAPAPCPWAGMPREPTPGLALANCVGYRLRELNYSPLQNSLIILLLVGVRGLKDLEEVGPGER